MNKKIKIAFIFGTRPETIKMYPVIKESKKYPNLIEPIVILTAQHREMMDQMTELLKIKCDFDLGIMKHGQSITQINCQSLLKLEEVLMLKKPDIVLVQGDTTTTFSGALASFYQKTKIGHIEAGLRTAKKYYPYPEEINRRLTTVLADYHFAPTKNAADSLKKENINRKNILITGNTVIDSLLLMQDKQYQFSDDRINKFIKTKKQLLLVTMHRRENWGEPLENLCKSLVRIIHNNNNLGIVFPVHKNP
ncbi:MAG: UDP-N-acetylglucosamine 2-epimerase (non-hydrolyzing), partial [Atribacterota bacterium]|nr:UDP-N-acetylglucosamine 2-epimerase (non-hydrolyzing) [Atribacterota bacterium]